MDALYDHLENYYDEKIIEELRNENKELKAKVEEYSSAMARLQKDFDNLNSEFKKLETNYSSLLKTARAEIERKSEMIKSLNIEKDMLIIKSIQNSGKNNFNRSFNKHNTQPPNKRQESDTTCAVKPQPEPKSVNRNEGNRQRNDRQNTLCGQLEDTISKSENKPNFIDAKELRNNNNELRNKTDKRKENISNENQNDISMKSKGEKINNRRKSMPFSSNIEPIFSSDDDFEALSLKNIRKSPLREGTSHYNKYRSRESCSSKDRFYSKRTNRFIDHGKYIPDRYDFYSKYTRQSPEKYRSKYTKEHSETQTSRRLRSPHSDMYKRSKSRERKTFERENYYDTQRYTLHNYDNSVVKHKMRNELEEPSCKRHKSDQSNKASSIEENMFSNNREIEHSLKGNFMKHKDIIEISSCQSPDYVNIENTMPQHVIKEIKHMAVTPLEDPRVSSKKYVIKSCEGKTFLSTLDSEDVNIQSVDWDPRKLKNNVIPPTLPKLSSEGTDKEIVKDMDFNKPSHKDALVSQEIQICENDENEMKSYIKDSGKNETIENNINGTENLKKNYSSAVIESNKSYKIPKLKNPDKISAEPKHEDFNQLSENRNYAIKNINENIEHKIEKHCKISTKSRPSPNTEMVTLKRQYKNSNKTKINPVENTLTAISCTLAEDLELSDEPSENRDVDNDNKTFSLKSSKNTESASSNLNKRKNDMPLVNEESQNSIPELNRKSPSLKKKIKDSSRESSKTRKTKKKSEIKDVNTTEIEQNKEVQTFNKLKSKPAISIQTKHKFSDLFGDSSSLITPDDLGIPTPINQIPLTDKYSIFDNTQDAVDLSVEDIKRTQCSTSKTSTFPSIREDQPSGTADIEIAGSDAEKNAVNKGFYKNKTANTLLENLPTINDDSETVNTVIISTGVQPNYASERSILQDCHKNNTESIDDSKNDKTAVNICVPHNVLAASTPHKTEHIDISKAILNEPSNITENTNLSTDISNASNSGDVTNDADAPDVRIIVKRRRKLIKKPS